ncbi:rhamnogalacturonan acetylesterase [Neobacillus dielmonensis]|uniref:rhamnogalacturonan acetylesterase n=1 Tax=Neobacillus dielmonensis TaxID=1347369 RepID=UPI0005A5E17C|nr:rhamnogalacturonan acetylesterase [Neobacillus dielmonensis]
MIFCKKFVLGEDQVSSNELLYSTEKGYGFVLPEGIDRDEDKRDSLPGEYCIPQVPSFIVDVPNGNYRVKVNNTSSNEITIKTGQGHLHRKLDPTRREECLTVHVNDRRLKVAFIGEQSFTGSIEIENAPDTQTVYLAGDSTATDQRSSGYPYYGWGQMLPFFLGDTVAVSNHAGSGRSSKSFINEGRLEKIWNTIQKNDFLLIQFGHNDEKDDERGTEPFSTFQEHLKIYIDGARTRGAIPVLISPMHRRFFDEEGNIINTHGDYIAAMEELSFIENVSYIDLAGKSKTLYESLGDEGTKKLFTWAAPGAYAKFPDGIEDNTHFQELGALAIAKLVVEGIRENNIENLASALRMINNGLLEGLGK